MIANIVPESKTFNADFFSYKVPPDLEEQIKVGSLVKIPFGKREMRGVVYRLKEDEPTKFPLKEIKELASDFVLPKKYFDICRWISDRYFSTLGEAISLFLPPAMRRPRKDFAFAAIAGTQQIVLSEKQQEAYEEIRKMFKEDEKPVLLHGVTGSGKTELYIKLAEETVKTGRQVIVLIPEIILTPQTINRFEKVFGPKVCLMHSNLSKSERFNCFYDFYSGKKQIVVGPRSALLIPTEKIGLIVIDEEQEDAFKQEQSPRYQAVSLAYEICRQTGAKLLIGTATPTVESYYLAQNGNYHLQTLTDRYQKTELPEAEIIDMRQEIKAGNYSPISQKLEFEIKEVLKNKRQVLLYMNRRGTATFVSCRDCGHVICCKNCSIPLVYHVAKENHRLNCHHCDYSTNLPDRCPVCGSYKIKYFGTGIEKIEQEIRKKFPEARVDLIDSSSARTKNHYKNFYDRLKNGETDIAIGTQMIAKGLDIPGVDLVGIISADVGLNMPFFRAGEKVFSLLTQVSGRSGRNKGRGKTIIQTYWPEAYPIIFAGKHDYSAFYKKEVYVRKTHDYPPFSMLINAVSENQDENRARTEIEKLAIELKSKGINFIGPGKCFYQRVNNKFRYHLIIKTSGSGLGPLKNIAIQYPQLIWDTEPVNLL